MFFMSLHCKQYFLSIHLKHFNFIEWFDLSIKVLILLFCLLVLLFCLLVLLCFCLIYLFVFKFADKCLHSTNFIIFIITLTRINSNKFTTKFLFEHFLSFLLKNKVPVLVSFFINFYVAKRYSVK